jgi:endoglucanase
MKKLFIITAMQIILLCICEGCSKEQSTQSKQQGTSWSAPSTVPLDPFAQNKKLGRGVNFGNCLEAPAEGDWGFFVEKRFFKLIKDAGFQSVRIPIRWSTHAAATAPYTIDKTFFTRIDEVVGQALDQGLRVVINIHHYDELFTSPAAHKDRLLALWQQISTRYKGYPDDLFFEVLNEPNGNMTAEIWNAYLVPAIQAIRTSNPYRILIVGPPDWNSYASLDKLQLPENERGLIVTFHYYNPFMFTHQGADWVSGSSAWLGTTWTASVSEINALKKELDAASAWAKAHNRPLYMGEFGSYSKADITSRALWTMNVARQAENRDMSWAYWEFCAGFGVYNKDTNAWNVALQKAMLP